MNTLNMNVTMQNIFNTMLETKFVKDNYAICSPLRESRFNHDSSHGKFTTIDGDIYHWENNVLHVTPFGSDCTRSCSITNEEAIALGCHVIQMDALSKITGTAACIKGYSCSDVTVLSVDDNLVAMMIEGEYVAFYPKEYANWLFLPTPPQAHTEYLNTYS